MRSQAQDDDEDGPAVHRAAPGGGTTACGRPVGGMMGVPRARLRGAPTCGTCARAARRDTRQAGGKTPAGVQKALKAAGTAKKITGQAVRVARVVLR